MIYSSFIIKMICAKMMTWFSILYIIILDVSWLNFKNCDSVFFSFLHFLGNFIWKCFRVSLTPSAVLSPDRVKAEKQCFCENC